jgi:GntR family transcriptional regulator, rspAB operon transcriptional repressor
MTTNNLKSQAYNQIKEKIINCEYQPGSILNEERIQQDINTSRTPIREALTRLEQEGLIAVKPKKGILVSPFTLDELNMIFEIRLIFEPYALLNYGYMLKEEVLLDFYQKTISGNGKNIGAESFTLDDEFHASIISVVPNTYIRQTYDIISTQNRRYRILSGVCQKDRIKETLSEHLGIIQACLKKEWQTAAENMKTHLTNSKNSTFEVLLEKQFLFKGKEQ